MIAALSRLLAPEAIRGAFERALDFPPQDPRRSCARCGAPVERDRRAIPLLAEAEITFCSLACATSRRSERPP